MYQKLQIARNTAVEKNLKSTSDSEVYLTKRLNLILLLKIN
jgi:hypothetical protein